MASSDTTDRVGAIVLDRGGSVLVVDGPDRWALPKGPRRVDETPLAAAQRHVLAATGLNLSAAVPHAAVQLPHGVYFVYWMATEGAAMAAHLQQARRIRFLDPRSHHNRNHNRNHNHNHNGTMYDADLAAYVAQTASAAAANAAATATAAVAAELRALQAMEREAAEALLTMRAARA